MTDRLRIDPDRDLLRVDDVQDDVCAGGAPAVADGDAGGPAIGAPMPRLAHVAIPRDRHPPRHRPFASARPGRVPFHTVRVACGAGTPRPAPCVQGTRGAASREEQHARRQAVEATVPLDACRAIDPDGSLDGTIARMRETGIAPHGDVR